MSSCELTTIAEVKDWLRDPAHQVTTNLYVIKWIGAVPYIAISPRNRLVELEEGDDFAEVVLLEHRRRRMRPGTEGSEHVPEKEID